MKYPDEDDPVIRAALKTRGDSYVRKAVATANPEQARYLMGQAHRLASAPSVQHALERREQLRALIADAHDADLRQGYRESLRELEAKYGPDGGCWLDEVAAIANGGLGDLEYEGHRDALMVGGRIRARLAEQ